MTTSALDYLRQRVKGGTATEEPKRPGTKIGLLMATASAAMQKAGGPMGGAMGQLAQAASGPIIRKLEQAENEATANHYCAMLGQLLIEAASDMDYEEFATKLTELETAFFQ